MSTIKSSDDHLTLSSDGSNKDIKFQANGVEKASISSAGAFTSTTIDATKLTGDLPAISGANLTGVGVSGITSTADATAITIDSSENVGIGVVPETWDANYDALQVGGNGSLAATPSQAAGGKTLLGQNMYVDSSYKYISTDEASLLYQQNGEFKFRVAASGSADAAITWTDALQIKNDGRGLSQFTAKCWIQADQSNQSINDSHNVSSVSDGGTGETIVNFTNNMANDDYAVTSGGQKGDIFSTSNRTTSSFNMRAVNYSGSNVDVDPVMAIVFGD